jgi:hypothetical protein
MNDGTELSAVCIYHRGQFLQFVKLDSTSSTDTIITAPGMQGKQAALGGGTRPLHARLSTHAQLTPL